MTPIFRKSPTDYSALYTALKLCTDVNSVVVGPHRTSFITLDVYEHAVKIQLSGYFGKDVVLLTGGFHHCLASLHALGICIAGSGFDSLFVEAGICSNSTVMNILDGKAYKRGIEFHITQLLLLYSLMFEVVMQQIPLHLIEKCNELLDGIHKNSSSCTKSFKDIQDFFEQEVSLDTNAFIGDLSQYLISYLNQIESLLHLIRSFREDNYPAYLLALEEQATYYVAHDLYKYLRFTSLHLVQMQELKVNNPTAWQQLVDGDAFCAKSNTPFTKIFIDQNLEQKIKELKGRGGIRGITQNENALPEFTLVSAELNTMVDEFLRSHEMNSKEKIQVVITNCQAQCLNVCQ